MPGFGAMRGGGKAKIKGFGGSYNVARGGGGLGSIAGKLIGNVVKDPLKKMGKKLLGHASQKLGSNVASGLGKIIKKLEKKA